MKPVEVDVVIGKRDLYRFLFRHNYSRFGGVFGALLSIGSLVGLAWFWTDIIWVQRVLLILLGLIFTVYQPMLLLWKGRRQWKSPAFQRPFHYGFRGEGIGVTQQEYKEFFKWEQVKKSVITKDSIYVYMSKQMAFIIPKSGCQGRFLEIAHVITNKTTKKK